MPPSAEEARRLLCALGDHVRDLVVASRGMDMAAVAGETVADTIYAIDRVADDALAAAGSRSTGPTSCSSPKGSTSRCRGRRAAWTVIVDTIDGTRGLMYDKRPAWCLAAAAPPGGGLADIVAAAMTELPTAKQGAADQLSATRGGGLQAERVDLDGGARTALDVRPSAATDLEHSFSGLAKFFLPGKPALAALEGELFGRLGETARLRRPVPLDRRPAPRADHGPGPLRRRSAPARPGRGSGLPSLRRVHRHAARGGGRCGHRPVGDPLAVPLDNVSPVAWVGYANEALAARIGPVLAELVDGLRAG